MSDAEARSRLKAEIERLSDAMLQAAPDDDSNSAYGLRQEIYDAIHILRGVLRQMDKAVKENNA